MSFRCGECGEAQEAGVRPNRVITQYAEREYRLPDHGVALGWEIVAEKDVCTPCLGKFEVVTGPKKDN